MVTCVLAVCKCKCVCLIPGVHVLVGKEEGSGFHDSCLIWAEHCSLYDPIS